jgi:hypothetical protein
MTQVPSACKLCAKERLAMLKLTWSTPHLAINRCNEIYGACRHNLGFHRFDIKEENNMVSTDEVMNAERVTHPNLSTPSSPPSSQTSWDDEEEVSNNNTDNQSLAAAVWNLLNPSNEEPPILTATDMRINPLDRHKQGLLTHSCMTRSTQSIAPPTFAWVRNSEGEPAGNFLMEEEATEGEFDELESGPTWI